MDTEYLPERIGNSRRKVDNRPPTESTKYPERFTKRIEDMIHQESTERNSQVQDTHDDISKTCSKSFINSSPPPPSKKIPSSEISLTADAALYNSSVNPSDSSTFQQRRRRLPFHNAGRNPFCFHAMRYDLIRNLIYLPSYQRTQTVSLDCEVLGIFPHLLSSFKLAPASPQSWLHQALRV